VWLVGILLFLAGSGATAYSIRAIDQRRRPVDVAFAIAAPLAALIALLGLILIFVPGFL
jgi:hypothetical protein